MTKAESKKRIHELYEKHYGKGKKKNKAAKQNEVVAEKVAVEEKTVAERQELISSLPQKKGQSRADLMLQAKEKGIKNFRVLNREELMKVLAPEATKESIAEVVQGAVTRWKSGWGSKGGRPVTQPN